MRLLSLVAALALFASACYSSSGPPPVQRVDPNAQTDLTGNWNDTDANKVAAVMIRDCLGRPWAQQFKAAKQKNPVVKLHRIRNRTSEHINEKFFTEKVEEELVNSGMVTVVAARDEAGDAREEKRDQSKHASDATKKEHQQEIGTDFIITGWINSKIQRSGGTAVRAYQVSMQLINAETQQKVWKKVHSIKKITHQPESEW